MAGRAIATTACQLGLQACTYQPARSEVACPGKGRGSSAWVITRSATRPENPSVYSVA